MNSRYMSQHYPLILLSIFSLCASICLNNCFFKQNLVFDSFLGWTSALFNKLLELLIRNIASYQTQKKFIAIYFLGSFLRVAILITFIFTILVTGFVNSAGFIFAFLIAYFSLFIYYIARIERT